MLLAADNLKAFVADLRKNPADWDTRLIYADCLEENGQIEFAEFQRWMVANQFGFDWDEEVMRSFFPGFFERVFYSRWSRTVSATPLHDFRQMQHKTRGYGLSFGAASQAIMTQQTCDWFMSNTNIGDFYGRRTGGLGTYVTVSDINCLLAGDDLPQIHVATKPGPYLWHSDGLVAVVGRKYSKQSYAARVVVMDVR